METYFDSRFPVAGLDLSRAFCNQSPRPLPQGQWDPSGELAVVPGVGVEQKPADVYGRTCAVGVNVRGFEASSERRRGGTRPGTKKLLSQAVLGLTGWLVQLLDKVVTVGSPVAANQMGRIVWLVSVSQGNVASWQAGDAAWTAANNATGNTPPLNFTGIIFSAANGQKLWFADGTNWCYFDPTTNTVYKWVATAGTLPVDVNNNKPRLICNWRGRICLAGWFGMPQALYMSAINDPGNWDLAPLNYTPTQAFATTLGPQNSPGAPITALIPFNDDVLICGTDHELWLVNGDPQAGGQISLLTNAIGVAWGAAWCQDPYGAMYFVSNKMGIYSMQPGQLPQRISQPIEQLINTIDTGTNSIRLVWDDRFQGIHVFITPLGQPAAAVHYFWEARTAAWWQEVFGNDDHNPIAVVDYDGNTTTDRSVLIGSWDGYVRYFDSTAVDDDGTTIESEVYLGPLLSKTFDEVRLGDMVCDLGETSGPVGFEVKPGLTAEAALSAASVADGTFAAGRSAAEPIRVAAHGVFVRLFAPAEGSDVGAWSFERLRIGITEKGPATGRRK